MRSQPKANMDCWRHRLALHSVRGSIQSVQIAERQGIPKQYLDQLLLMLKKAGLIESSRGRQGGYQLARPARNHLVRRCDRS